jgi:CubicO group peptidase (beta-lactamase class C family)
MFNRRRFALATAAMAALSSGRSFAAVNQSRLNAAVALGRRTGGSGVIYFDGRRIAAWGDQSKRYQLKSSTKSFGALLLGIAIKSGYVSLDGKAQNYLNGFGLPPSTNRDTGWLDNVSLRHLATHTSGFDKKGGFIPLNFAPGSAWSYSDGAANWLADVLTVKFRQDLYTVLRSRLLQSIGAAGGLSWRLNIYRPQTINGITRREFGSGISASVDAMARVGLLLADGGRGLIEESYIAAMRTPKSSVAAVRQTGSTVHNGANRHYGLLFWNNGDGAMDDVPTDAYWSWGLGDSFFLIIPSLELVVARAGPAWQDGWGNLTTIQPFFAAVCDAVS